MALLVGSIRRVTPRRRRSWKHGSSAVSIDFWLQLPGIQSCRDIQQKHHLSLVLVQRGTLKLALVGDEQRLHHAEDWLRILGVIESDPDSAARMRIKPEQKTPTEGGNEHCHGP